MRIEVADDDASAAARRQRVYADAGNEAVALLVDPGSRTLLDVGCGAGDNAMLITQRHPGCRVFGVTHSPRESEIAATRMERCWVFDIEREIPAETAAMRMTRRCFPMSWNTCAIPPRYWPGFANCWRREER